MDLAALEAQIRWNSAYRPAWDADPAAYVAAGVVGWGRSRRLGHLALPAAGFQAYLGVQHVDPAIPGWGGLEAPTARFFVSWFAGRQCLGLRTAPTLAAARAILWAAWQAHHAP